MNLGEFRIHWAILLASSIGLALGAALTHYTTSVFGPPLIAEFGWSKAQFALIGSVPLLSLFIAPFAGRFTDRFGSRAPRDRGDRNRLNRRVNRSQLHFGRERKL